MFLNPGQILIPLSERRACQTTDWLTSEVTVLRAKVRNARNVSLSQANQFPAVTPIPTPG